MKFETLFFVATIQNILTTSFLYLIVRMAKNARKFNYLTESFLGKLNLFLFHVNSVSCQTQLRSQNFYQDLRSALFQLFYGTKFNLM